MSLPFMILLAFLKELIGLSRLDPFLPMICSYALTTKSAGSVASPLYLLVSVPKANRTLRGLVLKRQAPSTFDSIV